MDTNTPRPPSAPDHGPDDRALVRILRALAAPLRARPDADVRRQHIVAASAAARAARTGQAAGPAARRAGARRGIAGMLRPAFAGGLALSLVVGLVAAVTVTLDDRVEFELAMEPGFTPSPIPFEREEEHVILTVDADRADEVTAELTRLAGADPTVLSVRTDRTAFTVPASIAEQLVQAPDAPEVETVVDTPMTRLATPTTQSPVPSWGLDRIDARDTRLDDSYGFVSSGSGVRVYVIDTGVRSDHTDLAGRVAAGWSAIEDGRGSEDCNGHGTHVAGTVAGSSYGVAKGATIVAIRVLDCNGSGFASSVVSGISWAIANHPGGPGVINLSLGGPANSAVDQAVADATARGLLVVAAAGNNAGDACALSPARAPSAITIGATTSSDVRASYSNFGSCVDLFAPGSSITSAWWTSTGAAATLSGTSMAAPHVAGIAARLLQTEPGAGPAGLTDALTGNAEPDSVSDPAGSPNLLLNLVDYVDECEQAYEDHLQDGTEIPEDCLEDVCERLELEGIELPAECLEEEQPDCDQLEEDGAELPEECLDEEAPDCDQLERDGAELPEECLDEDDGREGRPDSPPGLGGLLPPGFGGPVPGLERAPGLDGRLPPGLSDGVPPGLADREDRVPPGQVGRQPDDPTDDTDPDEEETAPEPDEATEEVVEPTRPGPPPLQRTPADPPGLGNGNASSNNGNGNGNAANNNGRSGRSSGTASPSTEAVPTPIPTSAPVESAPAVESPEPVSPTPPGRGRGRG